MMRTQRLSFRKAALQSGLLTTEQIDTALERISSQNQQDAATDSQVTDGQLSSELVDCGLLTSYQSMQLQEGKIKFRLKDYRILDFIGKGGMGQVFKAVHEIMGRDVAIKVLPRERCTPEAIENFEREARNQAGLDHPNLVRAYDAGHDGNVYFLVTEFVPGTDLRKFVRQQGILTESQAAHVIRQAAIGLEYAHRRGLIHRDVKPGNLLVTSGGVTKVSDLGLAGFVHESDQDPRAGRLVGTPDYIPPEVVRNPKKISAISDIYSLGCTLYYAVTGKVPFPGGKTRDKIRRHLEEDPWHPSRLNQDLSEEFVDVLGDMMEKDPALRIQSAAEVAQRMEPWAALAGPVVTQPARSRWLPPPFPSGEGLSDTADLDDSPSSGFGSQLSQGTYPVVSALEETDSASTSSLFSQLASEDDNSEVRRKAVLRALFIAVPVSALLGVLLTLGFLWMAS